ncbi:MAG: dTMP kinase [Erysipelothrix sp.]|nr:dTMP kinase [Erysipelothrix sp.]
MRQKALFVTFEGPDGSGKTTISQAVYNKLKQLGYNCIYTREPGGIRISEDIRDIILDTQNTNMDIRTEALLYAASRRQHLIEKIIPALKNSQIVICDRFIDSSLAYQGVGRSIGFDEVLQINQFAIEGLFPDLTIYLDISAEEGLKRIEDRDHKDRLDLESIDFHNKVHQGYQLVLERFKDRIQIVDANQTIEQITDMAVEIIIKENNNE